MEAGQKVLFYGRLLTIVAFHETKDSAGENVELVEAVDVEGRDARDAAERKIKELRMEQAAITERDDPRQKEIHAEITALDADARKGIVSVKIKKDSLSYWKKKDVWVSDGRILSDNQIAEFKKVTGNKPLPTGQRAALVFLESVMEA